MHITTAINLVENNLSSIFTKQDVLDLLNRIDNTAVDSETGPAVTLDETQRASLTNDIIDAIRGKGMGIIEDYELEMNWKEVELTEITLDESALSREIEETIKQWQENQIIDNQ
jgi:hypothetical protein